MISPPWPLSKIAPRCRRTQAPALCLALLIAGAGGGAEESPAALSEWIGGLTSFYNERSELQLPQLDSEQLTRLERGEVVHLLRREPRPGPSEESDDRLVALRLIPQRMQDVWLAALDPDLPVASIYHDFRLWHDDAGNSRWCVLLDLPWPLADRYWTVDLSKSTDLAEASSGMLWEHRWELSDRGSDIAIDAARTGAFGEITPERLREAVYTPVNRGGVLTADLGEHGTLLLYHLSTVIGGFIPDALVNAISRREVERFLEQAAERSAGMHDHYDADHEPVFGGDGRPIARE